MDAAAGANWRWQSGYFLAVIEGISIIISLKIIFKKILRYFKKKRKLLNDLV